MGKVELLAPAGNYDALRGAIRAGADAVYLGGEVFGARAYAENFSKDELCAGIRMAHVFGVKIYLTVNTLVKNKELEGLYDYLLPLYENGLDAVIVQDLGVLRYIRAHFPDLKIHASTQMTITGEQGAALLMEEGCEQIVPARELGISEIRNIKEKTGIKVEAFIHGAMCYCYSGQCLFSSILGGRSGNRGRCAQPCRLPYAIEDDKPCYPLSMRDMCTLQLLPELLEAGIDSFKIEGRMKKPAYAAQVTAIYRKYIDLYYENREAYQVQKEDLEVLQSLYIRSEISEGYYHRTNGRDMITLNSPAYSSTSESLIEKIEQEYIIPPLNQAVTAQVFLVPGERAKLILEKSVPEKGGVKVTSMGEVVQNALKQPLTEEKIKEQIQKSGNTFIHIEHVAVHMNNEVFLPVKAINELRREAVSLMENELIRLNGKDYSNRVVHKTREPYNKPVKQAEPRDKKRSQLQITVNTEKQLVAALRERPDRIYLESGLISNDVQMLLEDYKNHKEAIEFVLTSPYIVRQKDTMILEEMMQMLQSNLFTGILIRNLESLHYFKQQIRKNKISHPNIQKKLILDTNLYIWNKESLHYFEDMADEFFLPIECNQYEWKELLQVTPDRKMKASVVVYGRIPMMISANCVYKTVGKYEKSCGFTNITDRMNKQFPVYTNCRYCYNVIYNCVPLSLHQVMRKLDLEIDDFRLDFTVENEKETADIIRYYKKIRSVYEEPSYMEYTTGHYKRGVE